MRHERPSLFAPAPYAFTTCVAITDSNFECTDDCSGHEAGYNWAEENEIDDDSYCNTESSSFNEGCASYVEENADSQSSDEEDEGEDDGY